MNSLPIGARKHQNLHVMRVSRVSIEMGGKQIPCTKFAGVTLCDASAFRGQAYRVQLNLQGEEHGSLVLLTERLKVFPQTLVKFLKWVKEMNS
ncbi:hypothetical protein CKALI_11140 [Corynebacterium kalinowskii]|uniref:Uncharacterized protein n=1 Tax=Corynebacterium kalinowskii TaxID=2675216 RepID=A0A6B8VNS8_9CORY|nr:hypothetical protein [Corynebacterium kalinowskii]QGU03074.1 hypothetical protein CKALI_11140 [Corynebacterium kalinowskii]